MTKSDNKQTADKLVSKYWGEKKLTQKQNIVNKNGICNIQQLTGKIRHICGDDRLFPARLLTNFHGKSGEEASVWMTLSDLMSVCVCTR